MSFQHDHLMGSRPTTVGAPYKVNHRVVSLQHHHLTGSRWITVEEPIKGSSTDDTIPCRFSANPQRDLTTDRCGGTHEEPPCRAVLCAIPKRDHDRQVKEPSWSRTSMPCRFVSKKSPIGNTTDKWGNPHEEPPCRVVHIRSHYGITTTNSVGDTH